MKSNTLALLLMFTTTISSCGQEEKSQNQAMSVTPVKEEGLQTATFGSGCFWCTEAIFLNVDGVLKVESGYEGGKVKNPTYKEVCSGLTGHAEVIQLKFDPNIVTY
jgi:peptide-methionine (S)-S-oxide reductase